MKSIYIFLLVTLCYAHVSFSQKCFQRTFGGGKRDNAFEIVSTKDKGFMTIGSTNSFGLGKNDIYLVKMDSIGNLQWAKTYGGASDDYGRSIDKTKDGNYVIGAYSQSYSKEYPDICVIKINEAGEVLWSKSYGLDKSDYLSSIRSTQDGGFIILGETINFLNHEKNSDMLLIRLDPNGNVLWAKVYGGNNTDYGYSIQETADSGFIIGGETNSFGAGEWDFYVMKLKKDGSIHWTKTFGGDKADYGRYAIQTKDGGYLIAGNSFNFGAAETDVLMVKMDPSGGIEWSKMFGGMETDYLLSINRMQDDRLILSGYTNSFGLMVEDAFVAIVNAKGKVIVGKAFGGESHDYGLGVVSTNEDLVLCGTTQSFGAMEDDVFVVKTKLKWIINECNTNSLYPLNINNKVEVKVSDGGYELELHCQEEAITMGVSNSLTAEQVLCIEEAE